MDNTFHSDANGTPIIESKPWQPSPTTPKFATDETGVILPYTGNVTNATSTPNSTLSFEHSQNQILNKQFSHGSSTFHSRPFSSSSTATSPTSARSESNYSSSEPLSAQPLLQSGFAAQQQDVLNSAVPSSPTEYQYMPQTFTQPFTQLTSNAGPLPEKRRRYITAATPGVDTGPSLGSPITAAYGDTTGTGTSSRTSTTMVSGSGPNTNHFSPTIEAFLDQRPSPPANHPSSGKLARFEQGQPPSASRPTGLGELVEEPTVSLVDAPPVYSPR